MSNKKQQAAAPEKVKRQAVDYDRIEPGWRAGIKSVLQLAAEYEKETGQKISHTAIRKHFVNKGITRDLADKVQARAQAKVSAAAVSTLVSAETGVSTKPTETEIVEANADLMAGVTLGHRKDIARSRALGMALLAELENQTFSPELFAQLADLIAGPPITGTDPADKAAEARRQRLLEAFDKTMSTPSRIDSMKKLADTLKTLVTLEREAYGIGEDKGGGNYEDFLDQL